jgi:hypothetical protein
MFIYRCNKMSSSTPFCTDSISLDLRGKGEGGGEAVKTEEPSVDRCHFRTQGGRYSTVQQVDKVNRSLGRGGGGTFGVAMDNREERTRHQRAHGREDALSRIDEK